MHLQAARNRAARQRPPFPGGGTCSWWTVSQERPHYWHISVPFLSCLNCLLRCGCLNALIHLKTFAILKWLPWSQMELLATKDAIDEKYSPSFLITKVNLNCNLPPFPWIGIDLLQIPYTLLSGNLSWENTTDSSRHLFSSELLLRP